MLRSALSLYRRHFGALVVTGALAIAPASLLVGGSLYAVLPRLAAETQRLPEKEPRPSGEAARLQQFDISLLEPAHPLDAIRAVLPLLYKTFWGVLLAFSVPAVMQERLPARAALHRSWHLARDHWPAMLGLLVLLIAFSALASALAALVPEGPLRAVIATGIRCLLWPLPLAGLAQAYHATIRA
jgi:hypothetical protein